MERLRLGDDIYKQSVVNLIREYTVTVLGTPVLLRKSVFICETMTSKSHQYCCVPQCGNYAGRNVSIHVFPKDEKIRKKWQVALKIGKPVTKYMVVCGDHFKPADFFPSSQMKMRRKLKKGVIPSQKIPCGNFPNKNKEERKSRKMLLMETDESTSEIFSLEIPNSPGMSGAQVDDVEMVVEKKFKNVISSSYGKEKTPLLHISLDGNTFGAKSFADKGTQTEPYDFNLIDALDTDRKLYAFTGTDTNIFKNILSCSYNVAKENHYSAALLKIKLFLVLVKLKLNMPFVCLAILFNLKTTTCRRYFYEVCELVATTLKPLIYWPTKEEILNNIPNCFGKFRSTRVVLDCTEVHVQKCKSLQCRIRTYSHYKHTHTLKWLVGITPSGLISYVSRTYGGRTSDKKIVLKENIIAKCEPNDSIMVDKGFLIEKECEELFIKLIRPPFLRKKQQLSKQEAEATADIARARVHVERAIQRIKTFAIINEKIHWYLVPYIDSIATIICALMNLSSPILADDKFDAVDV